MIYPSLELKFQRKQFLELSMGMDYEVTDEEKHHFDRRCNSQARLKHAWDNLEKDNRFWKCVIWSDEMKLELFDHSNVFCIWRKESCIIQRTLFLK